jgi:hypothetical protein
MCKYCISFITYEEITQASKKISLDNIFVQISNHWFLNKKKKKSLIWGIYCVKVVFIQVLDQIVWRKRRKLLWLKRVNLSFYHHNNSILTGVLGIGRLYATRGFVIFMCKIVVKRVFKFVGAKNVCEKVCPSQPVTFVLYRNDHYWRLILLLEGFWCLLLIVLKKIITKKLLCKICICK